MTIWPWSQVVRTVAVCVGLTLLGATVPNDATGHDQTRAKLAELLDRYAENGQICGAILVARKGEVIYKRGFGYANEEWKIPNTPDTKFRIGSITKSFTATLVFQLVEDGRLELDAPVTRYLPGYPSDPGDRITISGLLTHTSGLINDTDIPDFDDLERIHHSDERLMAYFKDRELAFEPGGGRRYSNFGYALLAMILEHVSGKSYAELLQERILAPLGMHDTGVDDNTTLVDKRASGYHHTQLEERENAPYLDMSVVKGAGQILSTVEDMFLFDRGLAEGRLLSPEMQAVMLAPTEPRDSEDFLWASGFFRPTVPIGIGGATKRILQSAGNLNGFIALYHGFEDGNAIILLTNLKEYPSTGLIKASTDDVVRDVAAILYDEPYELPRKSAAYELALALADGGVESMRSRRVAIERDESDRFAFIPDQFPAVAQLFLDRNEPENAGAFLGAFPDLVPDSYMTDVTLAVAASMKGDDARARELMEKAGARDLSDSYQSLTVYGLRLLDEGLAREAVHVLGLVANAFPQSAYAQMRVGRAYWSDGNREAAIASLERSLKIKPDLTEARSLLDDIRKGGLTERSPDCGSYSRVLTTSMRRGSQPPRACWQRSKRRSSSLG